MLLHVTVSAMILSISSLCLRRQSSIVSQYNAWCALCFGNVYHFNDLCYCPIFLCSKHLLLKRAPHLEPIKKVRTIPIMPSDCPCGVTLEVPANALVVLCYCLLFSLLLQCYFQLLCFCDSISFTLFVVYCCCYCYCYQIRYSAFQL